MRRHKELLKVRLGLSTQHHIKCRSRGGKTTDDNIALIDSRSHSIYHYLFENKLPEEILEYLVDYFWNGKLEFVRNFLNNKEGKTYVPKTKLYNTG